MPPLRRLRPLGLLALLALLCAALTPARPVAAVTPPTGLRFAVTNHRGGPVKTVAVSDEYRYVGLGIEFAVFNATLTDALRLGYLLLPGVISDIFLDGSYAYVTYGALNLAVIDISDPAAPALLGTAAANAGYGGKGTVVAYEGYAYVMTQGGLHITIVDVRNPRRPTIVGEFEDNFDSSAGVGMAVDGQRLYVVGDLDLAIFDLSDPRSPALVRGRYRPMPRVRISDMALHNEELYLALYQTVGVVNVDDPLAPETTLYPLPAQIPATKRVADHIAVTDTHIYLTGELDYLDVRTRVFHVLSYTQTTTPTLAASLDLETIGDIVIDAGYAYLTSDSAHGGAPPRRLRVIDITQPDQPVLLDGPEVLEPHFGGNVSVHDGSLYAGQSVFQAAAQALTVVGAGPYSRLVGIQDGYGVGVDVLDLEVLDLTTTPTPTVLHRWTQGGLVHSPVISDGWMLFGESGAGCHHGCEYHSLRALDFRDPQNPNLQTVHGSFAVGKLVIAGDYLYALPHSSYELPDGSGQEWVIFDIGSLPDFSEVARFTPPAQLVDLVVDGQYLYATLREGGLQIFDISDPLRPVEVGQVRDERLRGGLLVQPPYAYIHNQSQIAALDISDAAARAEPPLVAISALPHLGGRLVAYNNALYIGNSWGLTELRLEEVMLSEQVYLPSLGRTPD